TPSPSATLTETNTQAVVLIPSPRPTSSPTLTSTIPPSLTFLPPPSPLPTLTTIAPVGVREPTSAPITAAPGTDAAQVTPAEAVSTPALATLTAQLLPTGLPPFPPLLPTIGTNPQLIPNEPQPRAFALSSSGGTFSGNNLPLPFTATTFARNPSNPNDYALVDDRGLLYLFSGGLRVEQGALVRTSPFAEPEPLTRDANNAIVTQVAWSPDGQTLAFLVDAEKDDRDGIWIMPNGQGARQLFRECPPPLLDRNACTVIIGGEPSRYTSLRFDWNASSTAILVRLFLPDEGRGAFKLLPLGNDPTILAPILRYDYASWSQDGSRILVSGAGRDNRVALRWLDPATLSEQMILDGSAQGLWLQDAVERPGGQVVALGSPNGFNSPMSLYNSSGQALSGQIGASMPERVTWSPDRSAVLVVTNDGTTHHYYVAQVNGTVEEITGQVAVALAVEWLDGAPPPAAPTVLPPAIPTQASAAATLAPVGVVGSDGVPSVYGITINQQVQVISPLGAKLRSAPSTSAQELELLNTYDYVLIIGGPVEAEGLVWWQVQTRTGQSGWAAESDGFQQLLSLTPLPGA
ncbi:MAG: SH3 domain-containing protein, partial [Chloroflexota bacterium]